MLRRRRRRIKCKKRRIARVERGSKSESEEKLVGRGEGKEGRGKR